MKSPLQFRHRQTTERTALAEILDYLEELKLQIADGLKNPDELISLGQAEMEFGYPREWISKTRAAFVPEGGSQKKTTRRAMSIEIQRQQEEQCHG